jgi:hypothetical protein
MPYPRMVSAMLISMRRSGSEKCLDRLYTVSGVQRHLTWRRVRLAAEHYLCTDGTKGQLAWRSSCYLLFNRTHKQTVE